MNLFYEELPDSVTVSGSSYQIYTNFRDWLKFFDLQEDTKISQRDRILLMFRWYKEIPPLEHAEEALNALIAFAVRDEKAIQKAKKNKNKSTSKILSWSYDAAYIYSAFLPAYQIDLLKTENMHWHLFLNLFDALPEDMPVKQRMSYRAVNLSTVRDKAERKRIRKIQEQIRIPHEKLSASQTGDFFG